MLNRKGAPVESCFAVAAMPAFQGGREDASSRRANRQDAKDAKKEFFLCRVDGKGKGFALRRSF